MKTAFVRPNDLPTVASERQQGKTRVFSWETAPDAIKIGLPSPPERDKFTSDEVYQEAANSWSRRIAPILALRFSAMRKV